MPVSFNSPPRNFFLLGSGGEDAVTNFFHKPINPELDHFFRENITKEKILRVLVWQIKCRRAYDDIGRITAAGRGFLRNH